MSKFKEDEIRGEDNRQHADAWRESASLFPDDLLRTAADPELTEDLALAILKRPDAPAEVLEQLARNANALKSRKVKVTLASHPHSAPRFRPTGTPVLHF
jgi:hypothetical protein